MCNVSSFHPSKFFFIQFSFVLLLVTVVQFYFLISRIMIFANFVNYNMLWNRVPILPITPVGIVLLFSSPNGWGICNLPIYITISIIWLYYSYVCSPMHDVNYPHIYYHIYIFLTPINLFITVFAQHLQAHHTYVFELDGILVWFRYGLRIVYFFV